MNTDSFILNDANLDVDTASRILADSMTNKFINTLGNKITECDRVISRSEYKSRTLHYSLNLIKNISKNVESYIPMIMEKQKNIKNLFAKPYVTGFDIASINNDSINFVIFIRTKITNKDFMNNFINRYKRYANDVKVLNIDVNDVDGVELTVPLTFEFCTSLIDRDNIGSVINYAVDSSNRINNEDNYEAVISRITEALFSGIVLSFSGVNNIHFYFTHRENPTNGHIYNFVLDYVVNNKYNVKNENDLKEAFKNITIENIIEGALDLFNNDPEKLCINTYDFSRYYFDYCDCNDINIITKEEKSND